MVLPVCSSLMVVGGDHLFMCPLTVFVLSLGKKMSILVFCSCFNWVILFFLFLSLLILYKSCTLALSLHPFPELLIEIKMLTLCVTMFIYVMLCGYALTRAQVPVKAWSWRQCLSWLFSIFLLLFNFSCCVCVHACMHVCVCVHAYHSACIELTEVSSLFLHWFRDSHSSHRAWQILFLGKPSHLPSTLFLEMGLSLSWSWLHCWLHWLAKGILLSPFLSVSVYRPVPIIRSWLFPQPQGLLSVSYAEALIDIIPSVYICCEYERQEITDKAIIEEFYDLGIWIFCLYGGWFMYMV